MGLSRTVYQDKKSYWSRKSQSFPAPCI